MRGFSIIIDLSGIYQSGLIFFRFLLEYRQLMHISNVEIIFRGPGFPKEAHRIEGLSPARAVRVFKKAYLRFLLSCAGGSRAKAARLVGIHPGSLSHQLEKQGLRREFPPKPPVHCRYELTFEPFRGPRLDFSGTLTEIENHYTLQVMREVSRDMPTGSREEKDREAKKRLSATIRDPYLGKVFKRLQRLSNLATLLLAADQRPLVFFGTLRELQRYYLMQVLEESGRDLALGQKALGYADRDVFIEALNRFDLGRRKPSMKNQAFSSAKK